MLGTGPIGTGPTGGPEPDRPDRTVATSAEQRLPIKDEGSRIQDQGSSIKHLGPCFGMNGHFRSDLDVISRPPESIIDSTSFFVVVGS